MAPSVARDTACCRGLRRQGAGARGPERAPARRARGKEYPTCPDPGQRHGPAQASATAQHHDSRVAASAAATGQAGRVAQQGDHRAGDQEGPEGDVALQPHPPRHQQREADDRREAGRHEDRDEDGRPAEEQAERRHQVEVAERDPAADDQSQQHPGTRPPPPLRSARRAADGRVERDEQRRRPRSTGRAAGAAAAAARGRWRSAAPGWPGSAGGPRVAHSGSVERRRSPSPPRPAASASRTVREPGRPPGCLVGRPDRGEPLRAGAQQREQGSGPKASAVTAAS